MKKAKRTTNRGRPKKQKTIKVVCASCGEDIDLENDGLFRSYDKKAKKWEFFCGENCIATWYGDEMDGEDIVEELENDGYKVLNKPTKDKTFKVLYDGEEVGEIQAETEEEAESEAENNLSVEDSEDC